MKRWLYLSHMVLGIIIALPALSWASSALVSLWPAASPTSRPVEVLEPARIQLTPAMALVQANAFTGRQLPITALTLVMRQGQPVYQAIGGLGADSVLIDAETGATRYAPPPGAAARFFSQAHFFYFSGRAQVPLMTMGCLGICGVVVTGLLLALRKWRDRRSQATVIAQADIGR